MVDTIINRAKAHYQAVKDIPLAFELGHGWDNYRQRNREFIPVADTVETVIHRAQNHDLTGFNHRRVATRDQMYLMLSTLAEEFPAFSLDGSQLEDSPYSDPATLHLVQQRTLSNIFFWHLLPYLTIVTHVVDKPVRILEVGSGLGELARLFRLATRWPNEFFYVLCDIPESLFYADVWLNVHFPDEAHYLIDPAEYWRPPSYPGFLLLPVQFCHVLKGTAFCVAVNQGSMQEMAPEAIGHWLRVFHQAQTKWFYSLNRHDTCFQWPEGWAEIYRKVNPLLSTLESNVDLELVMALPGT